MDQKSAQLDQLRSLSLSHFVLPELTKPLLNMLGISLLTELTLWRCEETNVFLRAVAETLKGTELNLKHFAVALRFLEEEEDIDQPLDKILSSCSKLESLCLEWSAGPGHEQLRAPLFAKISKLGQSLRVLSLHCSASEDLRRFPSSDTLTHQELKTLCSSCPHLEQLGIELIDGSLDEPDDLTLFMVLSLCTKALYPKSTNNIQGALADLPQLKILHLRQGFGEPLHEGNIHVSKKDMTYKLQRLANNLFDFSSLLSPNPSLEALVIGQDRRLSLQGEVQGFTDYTSRHCFIRREQKDILGRTAAIGVPVPSYILRYEKDYAGIMDWHFNWWCEPCFFMPRLPGRFHDD